MKYDWLIMAKDKGLNDQLDSWLVHKDPTIYVQKK